MSRPFALVVVHYRDPEGVDGLVSACREWDHPPETVLVVDNSSDYCPDPLLQVEVLSPAANVGYGAAANAGVREARERGYDFVLVTTQDCRLGQQASRALLEALLSDAEAAVAAPLLGYRDRPDVVFSAGGIVTRVGRTRHPASGSRMSAFDDARRRVIEWADGACLMVRAEDVQRVGGFDPAYFLYVEEVDLQFCLRQAGRRIILVPGARAWQSPGNYTPYLRYRNLTYFTRKYPSYYRRWPWVHQLYTDSRRALRLRSSPSAVVWGLRGYIDAVRGRMGPPPLSILRR